jgi:hypothetical protein
MFVLWWNVYGVLLALGQGEFAATEGLDINCVEPDVAAKAALYLKYLSFGIPGYGGNMVIKKRAYRMRRATSADVQISPSSGLDARSYLRPVHRLALEPGVQLFPRAYRPAPQCAVR